MRAARACSNPLCEHFWLMVPLSIDYFAAQLKQSFTFAPPTDKEATTDDMSKYVRKLGRKVWQWAVLFEDVPAPGTECAVVETYFSYELGRYVRKETYYFCDDCNEVLEKAS